MRSITVKLLLAFLVISLISVLLIAISARWLTEREFRTYLFNQNRNTILTALTDYYQKNGSWQGVEKTALVPGQANPPRFGPGSFSFFTLADAGGKVILAGPGETAGDVLSQADLRGGSPIKVNGKTAGTLLIRQPAVRVSAAETAFLSRIRNLFIFSAISVIILGLLLAFLLSRMLTRPIRELTAATQAVSAGQLEHAVPVRSRDELGQLAASFNQMNAELARSIGLRRQMTADIAHELRTPVSVILGHAEAVHEGVLPASQETFEIIRDEAERLDTLIEDLRTLSRADAGELPMDFQPVSPNWLLERVQAIYRQRAAQKNIRLEAEQAPGLPEISADQGRMVQVLSNLVDNAVLYTPEGGHVVLSASKNNSSLEFRVKDSGPGIPANELERVFDRFYRSDKSRQRNESGSGLGLAIARSLVEKHNGRIWAESQPGEGTTIIIHLPIPG